MSINSPRERSGRIRSWGGSASPQCMKEMPAWEMEKAQEEPTSAPLLEGARAKEGKLQEMRRGVRRGEGTGLTLTPPGWSGLVPPRKLLSSTHCSSLSVRAGGGNSGNSRLRHSGFFAEDAQGFPPVPSGLWVSMWNHLPSAGTIQAELSHPTVAWRLSRSTVISLLPVTVSAEPNH